ncbi:MAG: hypothetical protein WC872_03300 [Candidatus Absconditabacterales bacterium]
MKLIVDDSQRYAKMRAHTAAHLFHAEIVNFFPDSKQSGSFVDEDYFRFDFNADNLLNNKQIQEIEKNINQIIYDNCIVQITETSFDQAKKMGAKAFFEDKYGNEVRIVEIQKDQDEKISVELCAGTHVSNTKDIGCFAIVSQEAVASGIKRITAITGPKVIEKLWEKENILNSLSEKLGVGVKQLIDKLEKFLKENEEIKNKYQSLEIQHIVQVLKSTQSKKTSDFDEIIKISIDLNFKNVVSQAKILFEGKNILIYTQDGNFAVIGTSAKKIAIKLGLKGGGSDNLFQGKDETVTSYE